ncbi:MAG: acetyl-CoA C-acyltransferase, partial [Victivallales bacterium]|nr:acetyl-CoA C-acyltransferase [Victivallales bacterium]
MRKILLTGAVRTAIGDINGALTGVNAVELGTVAVEASLRRSRLSPKDVGEVVIGNVLQAGLGQNPARQIAVACDIPVETPSFTVNQVCGSGMKAVDLAALRVASGDVDAAIAGGVESMSGAPYILPSMRGGAKLGNVQAIDTAVCDGLTDAFGHYHMGVTAENIAEKYGISREEQDMFALQSQRKCAEAYSNGLFKDELVPVTIKKRKGDLTVNADEHPRPDTSPADLARLKTVFKKEGSVTPGNSSGINDGAASILVVAEDSPAASKLDSSSCVRMRSVVCRGCQPELMGLGPVNAVLELLEKCEMTVDDIDLWELNEAFAVQTIAVLRDL